MTEQAFKNVINSDFNQIASGQIPTVTNALMDVYQIGLNTGLSVSRDLINKAIDVLIDMSNDGYIVDIHHHEEFTKMFKSKMEGFYGIEKTN